MWMTLLTWVKSGIGKIVAIALAVGATVLVAFGAGNRSAKRSTKIESLEGYKKTRERIDEVPDSPDRDAAIDRMRDNGLIR